MCEKPSISKFLIRNTQYSDQNPRFFNIFLCAIFFLTNDTDIVNFGEQMTVHHMRFRKHNV